MIKAFDIVSFHAAGEISNATGDENSNSEKEDVLPENDTRDSVHGYSNVMSEFLSDAGVQDAGNEPSDQPPLADLLSACRLSCISYTLQLVIKDALKQVPAVDKIIKEASCCRLFSSLASLGGRVKEVLKGAQFVGCSAY